MKKKIASVFICGLILSGCGTSGTNSPTPPVSVTTEQVETTTSTSEENKSETETTEVVAKTVVLDTQIIYEKDGIKITAKGLSLDGFMGPTIDLLLENDTDKNITVQTRNSSVNGYMIDFGMSADVVAGKKANNEIDIYNRQLEKSGIDIISEIEFSFHIYESGTWETLVDTEQITLSTSAANNYTQMYDDSGDLLYEGNGVKIISKGLVEDDSILGPEFVMYIENNSEQNVTIQVRDTSVNGFMVDPSMSCEIMPGKKAVDEMTFLSSEFKANDITEVEEIETSFHIFNSDGWNTIVDTEPVLISFK